MGYNIGFVSTRFCGADGVTLESSKWAELFERKGHTCFWFAGQLDRHADRSFLVPEAHFKEEHNQWINDQVVGRTRRSPMVTEMIHGSRSHLKYQLHRFVEKFDLDLLVAQNALTIPMNIPLGMALTEIIAETRLPAIAHHHDFYWERTRYAVNAVGDYLQTAFPPRLPGMQHVVINSAAQEQLAMRSGVPAMVIPNVLDFRHPPRTDQARGKAFRHIMGLTDEDKIILQPTRIIQRKGIEHAIELVRALGDNRYKLVVTHESGDEGYEYVQWLKSHARERGVDMRLAPVVAEDPWAGYNGGKKPYTIWDMYAQADLVTYPSLLEGFGNAFLEAIYLKKPILINRYDTFVRDIEPLGFELAIMDGFLSQSTVEHVGTILASNKLSEYMVSHNYDVAEANYSYAVLEEKLDTVMMAAMGHPVHKQRHIAHEMQNIVYLDRAAVHRSGNIKSAVSS